MEIYSIETLEGILTATVVALAGVISFLFKIYVSALREERATNEKFLAKCQACEISHGKELEQCAREHAAKLVEFSARTEEAVRRYEQRADAVNNEYIRVLKDLANLDGAKK